MTNRIEIVVDNKKIIYRYYDTWQISDIMTWYGAEKNILHRWNPDIHVWYKMNGDKGLNSTELRKKPYANFPHQK